MDYAYYDLKVMICYCVLLYRDSFFSEAFLQRVFPANLFSRGFLGSSFFPCYFSHSPNISSADSKTPRVTTQHC